jgi:hypothetical protein
MIKIGVYLKIAACLNLVQTAAKIRRVGEQAADARELFEILDKCSGVEEVY